ncbi:hypothetical protein [Legionella sp. km772]|uniref:hypothetical protein n=1 Tax=Legionella sp. km772 TaxID=2498111 RepID=UPI000F8F191D|nr:hypothetical protein [Legionella sp. km772]RUR07051.1 hypothetical protein ELY15_12605 [Legionella sp. km772]
MKNKGDSFFFWPFKETSKADGKYTIKSVRSVVVLPRSAIPQNEWEQVCKYLENLIATTRAIAIKYQDERNFDYHAALNMANEMSVVLQRYKESPDNSKSQQLQVLSTTEDIIKKYTTKLDIVRGFGNQMKETLNNFLGTHMPVMEQVTANKGMILVTQHKQFNQYKNILSTMKAEAASTAEEDVKMVETSDSPTSDSPISQIEYRNTSPKR